jgi:acyl-CoA dehydrogenase
LCWHAAVLADLRQPNSVEASMAKAYAPRAALEAASLGIEILGAAGARCDRLLEKFWRDVKVLDIVEGTGEIQRLAMAKKLLGYKDDEAPPSPERSLPERNAGEDARGPRGEAP